MICKGLDGIDIVHIDLSYNCISDSGAERLAECLKVCCICLHALHPEYIYRAVQDLWDKNISTPYESDYCTCIL